MFNAVLIEKDEDGRVTTGIKALSEEQLPDGEVTIAVEYSTVNYKDGLCFTANGGGLVRNYPHVPGIDFAGTVESSQDPRYSAGDKVVLTGWRVGEAHWGGLLSKSAGEGRLACAATQWRDTATSDGHWHRGTRCDVWYSCA